ncbi:hypothetical protein M8745_19350 [Lutimaribacter sp. EGI FJ00014]|nr:hypothetical protein [Lutimaribacter sp. EGI FJ00014]
MEYFDLKWMAADNAWAMQLRELLFVLLTSDDTEVIERVHLMLSNWMLHHPDRPKEAEAAFAVLDKDYQAWKKTWSSDAPNL